MRKLSELTDWDRLLKRILWTQLGDISAVAEMEDNSFDMVFCHNVLEYIDIRRWRCGYLR